MRWDDNLEGPAKIIAESDDRLFCVQAGPGTGKSFALQRRIMRLLEEGVNPATIFACTFTNVAANDLQKKILEIGINNAKNVLVGTIHSYCFKVLSQNSVFETLHRVPRPLLKYECQPLYEDLKGGLFGDKRNVKRLVRKFEEAWACRQTENPGWPTDAVEKQFHEEIIKWLKVHKCMLIGELVPLTLDFFRKNPNLPDLTKFKYVFVDEYQDLNKAEQELIRLISGNSNLMVVGDVHQSIYAFKGAYPDGIRDFPSNNPNTKTQSLTICRRCPRQVVRLANELIKKNSHSSNAVLEEYEANPEGDVHILNWVNNEEETRGIAEIIDKYIHKKGFLPRDIVVLSPAAVLGKDLSKKLNELNIKNRDYFDDIFDLNPAKSDVNKPLVALSMLNLLNDPKDLVSLRCLVGFGEEGLLNKTWRAVMSESHDQNKTLAEILNLIVNNQLNVPQNQKTINRYQHIQSEITRLSGYSLREMFDSLFPVAEEWSAPFHNAVDGLDFEIASPTKLLQVLVSYLDKKEAPVDVDYIRIMSLHKSKGLNIPVTIIIGVIDGLLPGKTDNRITDDDELRMDEEEKRRLFYVAITRPTQSLILSSFAWLDKKISNIHQVKVKKMEEARVLTYASAYLSDFGGQAPDVVTGFEFLNRLRDEGNL